jgi:FkbM family methyltransferase
MPQGDRSARFGPLHAVSALLELWRPRQALLPLSRLARGDRVGTEAAVRALASAVPLADRIILCRSLGRYKLLVDAADLAHGPHLALDGFWEWWTTACLVRQLRPGARVVDAGAGYGYFTLLAAELVGPQGRVVAIEPHPRSAALLRRNIALNGAADRVEVVQAALAGPDAPLTLPLLLPEGDPAGAHLRPEDLYGPNGAAEAQLGIQVPVQTLDRFAPLRPDLVKLDLCGAEEAAWDGMQQLLAECPAVRLLVSFSAARCRAPDRLVEAMAGRFPLRRLAPDGTPRPVTAKELLAAGDAMLWLAR